MRTLGPGSIASLLKIALDVAYAVVWAAFGGLALILIAGLIASPFLGSLLHGHVVIDGRSQDLQAFAGDWPLVLALAGAVDLYLGVLLVIFHRLRLVFSTLTIGDPFRPENVGRLRTVGLGLIGLEFVGYAVKAATPLATHARAAPSVSVSLSAWFAILVVFVLAEVFREGARLRRDAELTI